MGMYIAIADGVGWATSRGVFDCIVEGTRIYLESVDKTCFGRIYESLDEQAQSFIVLRDIEEECFNKFYFCCEKAMLEFPHGDADQKIPSDHVEGILWNWGEVLNLMRHDSRFRALT